MVSNSSVRDVKFIRSTYYMIRHNTVDTQPLWHLLMPKCMVWNLYLMSIAEHKIQSRLHQIMVVKDTPVFSLDDREIANK